jgi:uncharacterized protein YbcV (DUF1398 family)
MSSPALPLPLRHKSQPEEISDLENSESSHRFSTKHHSNQGAFQVGPQKDTTPSLKDREPMMESSPPAAEPLPEDIRQLLARHNMFTKSARPTRWEAANEQLAAEMKSQAIAAAIASTTTDQTQQTSHNNQNTNQESNDLISKLRESFLRENNNHAVHRAFNHQAEELNNHHQREESGRHNHHQSMPEEDPNDPLIPVQLRNLSSFV